MIRMGLRLVDGASRRLLHTRESGPVLGGTWTDEGVRPTLVGDCGECLAFPFGFLNSPIGANPCHFFGLR
jgi:hypothetical protein